MPTARSPDYLALLDRLHRHLRPRTYLEIGVNHGDSLRLALPGTRAVGVDPGYFLTAGVPWRARIFRQTSDAFFARHDLDRVLGTPLDLTFIDGMHRFDYALRDFANAERRSSPAGVVVLHDTLPEDEAATREEPGRGLWAGDVWKLPLALRRWRPDLGLATVAAPPAGLTVVWNLDPASRRIEEAGEEIAAFAAAAAWSELAELRERLVWRRGEEELIARLPGSRRAATALAVALRRLRPPPPRSLLNRLKRRLKRAWGGGSSGGAG